MGDAFPLRIGSDREFELARAALRAAGFDEPTICEVFGCARMWDVGNLDAREAARAGARSAALEVLVRVFVFGQALEREKVEAELGTEATDALFALDLLRGDRERVHAPVFFSPVADLLAASDRHNALDGSALEVAPDSVFPAVFPGTVDQLRLLPPGSWENGLELCAGAGAAAIALAKSARRVTALDITPRSVHFARWNAHLNGVALDVRESDLYAAVKGETFDCILAHPPYLPSLEIRDVFRDGGDTGELLLSRIVTELPSYLRAGGVFVALCAGWDTTEAPFEQRAARWLGDAAGEFDVLVARQGEVDTAQVARQAMERTGRADAALEEEFRRTFAAGGLRRMVIGALAIARRRTDGEPLSLRLHMTPSTDGNDLVWTLRWHRLRRDASAETLRERIGRARPRLAPSLTVRTKQIVRDGALVFAEHMLESQKPFLSLTRTDASSLETIKLFNGTRTVAKVFERARQARAVPATLGRAEFLDLMATLIESGHLTVDDSVLEPLDR